MLNYANTVKAEGRRPDAVFRVYISQDDKFDATANAERNKLSWDAKPDGSKGETNCSTAVANSLRAGGIPVPQFWIETTPDELGAWLDLKSLHYLDGWAIPVSSEDRHAIDESLGSGLDDQIRKILDTGGWGFSNSFGTEIVRH